MPIIQFFYNDISMHTLHKDKQAKENSNFSEDEEVALKI